MYKSKKGRNTYLSQLLFALISTYEIEGMSITNLNRLAFDELRVGGLGRSAAEKFAGAWLACLLVMARGNIFDAFSVEHILLATVCGTCRSSAHMRQCPQLAKADRSAVGHLLRLDNLIDLAIPRGGEELIRRVAEEARMPVLKHYKGNCHIYVDRAADFDMAERILVNAKCQRPGVCNAAESLIVHRDAAPTFLPRIAKALRQRGVELRGCDRTRPND